MPLCIVNVLADWISKLFVTVKWDNHFSYWFPVRRFVVMLGKEYVIAEPVYSFMNHLLSA